MSLLIYGVTGYSGQLIVQQAKSEGLEPIVAGRDGRAVAAIADALRLEARTASLDTPSEVDRLLRDVTVLLNCAGPFVHTHAPLVEACLRLGVHYLDITGEYQVFEAIAARDSKARAAGIVMMPGTGFDVVPSDCLAAHLHRRLPSATSLNLGFRALGGLSRGTALTMIENLGRPGCIRRGGAIVPVPPAFDTRTIDFGDGPKLAVTIPWGDVSTAFYSTGIPDVRVYMSAHPKQVAWLKRSRYLGWILRQPLVRARLASRARAAPAGPSATARAEGVSLLWGEAFNHGGERVVSRLRGPEGYTLTALTSVRIAQRLLQWPPEDTSVAGFHTPSTLLGADFILGIDGVSREDVVGDDSRLPG